MREVAISRHGETVRFFASSPAGAAEKCGPMTLPLFFSPVLEISDSFELGYSLSGFASTGNHRFCPRGMWESVFTPYVVRYFISVAKSSITLRQDFPSHG